MTQDPLSEIEITQVRDCTPGEAKEATRATMRLMVAAYRRDTVYWVLRVLMFGMVIGIVGMMGPITRAHVDMPAWVGPAFLIGFAAMISLAFRMRHIMAMSNQKMFVAGDRYRIDGDGLSITKRHSNSFLSWNAIQYLTSRDDLMLIRLSDIHATMLPKGAFGDQDVAGFCAELESRWRAAHPGAQ